MMNDITQGNTEKRVKRIGILLGGLEKKNLLALRFLVLRMNSLQSTFEYEFLPINGKDDFVKMLSGTTSLVSRGWVKTEADSFVDRYQNFLEDLINGYKLKESTPDHFVLITTAKFSDNFYSTRRNRLSVLALGNWKRFMAPPSIVEFILTLIVRESVAVVSPSLRGSIHLGTKGCLCDFTPSLGEVRYKVLNGFVCEHCRQALQRDGLTNLAHELTIILGKEWLGELTHVHSPANTALKLGYNLFIAKGLDVTPWEKFVITIQEESVKQLLTILGAVLIAGILLWLGLK